MTADIHTKAWLEREKNPRIYQDGLVASPGLVPDLVSGQEIELSITDGVGEVPPAEGRLSELEAMTVAVLKSLAADYEIDGYKSMSKTALVSEVLAAELADDVDDEFEFDLIEE
jgi:hypothetical protein